jgi:hypothetical protein
MEPIIISKDSGGTEKAVFIQHHMLLKDSIQVPIDGTKMKLFDPLRCILCAA